MALSAERLEDRRLAEDLAKGIKRPRRALQECGAGIGSDAVAGCGDAPAAAGGRGGRGGAANTGEDTRER
jgi:hypothetical protein